MNNHLKQEIANIEIPIELHERSKRGVKKAKDEMKGKIKIYIRKRLVAGAFAACLLIPSGAWAYQTFLADELYGSYENIKRYISGATMEGYLLLDAKLSHVKGDLEKDEYLHFKELLTVITTSKLEYGNEYGNINYSQIPMTELNHIKEVLHKIQPYFDKLNGQKLSEEVLTKKEYENYIDALMTYEQIMAQSNMKNSSEKEKIPYNLREDFAEAEAFIMYVNDKQL
ncbi:DUF3600 domain-containing protein [Metabacillus niabensis]|uniref:DUF3600 domain-containing protein n=1 Tax=Metabacillus niabensis TaxID=324854 RepID=UPI001CFB25E1|nr:DUF3600 domain-containing protein [Metabacillus niabensis]